MGDGFSEIMLNDLWTEVKGKGDEVYECLPWWELNYVSVLLLALCKCLDAVNPVEII